MLIFLLLVAVSAVTSQDHKPPMRPKCGPNEEYVHNLPCPPSDCARPYTTYKCEPKPRGPGCDCIDGYLRGPDKKCIRKEKCPPPRPKCGPNEKYYPERPCPPRNCPDDKVYICDGRPEPRGPACDCIDGYLRGPDKKCRPKKKCPPSPSHKKCPVNERWADCGHQCANAFCPINDSRAVLLCKPPRDCKPGCVCKVGFRRRHRNNKKSKCIPAENCTPRKCRRAHEVWSRCPRCLDESCAAAHNPPRTCNELIKNCQPQCICKKGHFRNHHDKCVPKKQCPK